MYYTDAILKENLEDSEEEKLTESEIHLTESNAFLQKNGKRVDFPANGLCNWGESLLGQCNHSLVKEN